MVSFKIMWNSIISMPNAKVGSAEMKNMYLEAPLDWCKYMKMPLQLIPNDIIKHYRLREKAVNGYVYMEIRKGMYASHKPASLPTNSSNSVWHAMDTSNNLTRLASGSTLHNPSGSTCTWTTWGSNILVTKTQAPLCCPLGRNIWNCWRLEGRSLLWYLSCMEPQ